MKRKIILIKNLLLLLVARFLSIFIRHKNIWLVMEKKTEARDNGYGFYKYLCEKHPECNAWYVISSDSPDRHKIEEISDRLIEVDSFKHCVYFWAARYNVASQPFGAHPFTYFLDVKFLQSLKWEKSIIVFLRHGIVKDELPHALDMDKSNIDYFISSAKRERESVMQAHGYPPERVWLTGLCRYDNLKPLEVQSKQILIMPTFRHWLMGKSELSKPDDAEVKMFIEDDFYKQYFSLLSSQRLSEMLERYDYTLVFYPHYSAQRYLYLFEDSNRSNRVILASRDKYDVQKLLIQSDVLITDYSSVFFDFAYMKKPEMFFQFDEEKYRGGHYKEGYFVYRRDAFGPVVDNMDALLDYLEEVLKGGSKMEAAYIKKVDEFFAFTDQNNCERIYQSIMGVE